MSTNIDNIIRSDIIMLLGAALGAGNMRAAEENMSRNSINAVAGEIDNIKHY